MVSWIPPWVKVCLAHFHVFNRLVKHGRDAEAMAVISALEDKSFSDFEVQRTFHAIREAVAMEFPGFSDKKQSSFGTLKAQMKELFKEAASIFKGRKEKYAEYLKLVETDAKIAAQLALQEESVPISHI